MLLDTDPLNVMSVVSSAVVTAVSVGALMVAVAAHVDAAARLNTTATAHAAALRCTTCVRDRISASPIPCCLL